MLFYLLITVSSPRRDADEEERRDDPEERHVEVEKRFIGALVNALTRVLGK